MDKELLERYRKYLTNAQVKELAAKAERYKLLNAQRRAEAQNSILAQQRQTRRGLQNVGLASREGKVISGMETARNDALAKAYDTYDRQLRKVEEAQTQNTAARMVNANIEAQRRAAEEAYQRQVAEQARQRSEYNEQMVDPRLSMPKPNQLPKQQVRYDPDAMVDPRMSLTGRQRVDAQRQQAEQAERRYQQQRYEQAKQFVADYKPMSMRDYIGRRKYAEAKDIINNYETYEAYVNGDGLARFAVEYGINPDTVQSLRKTNPEAVDIVASTYKKIDENREAWDATIAKGEGIVKPKNRNEYERMRDANKARREMADTYSVLGRITLAAEAGSTERNNRNGVLHTQKAVVSEDGKYLLSMPERTMYLLSDADFAAAFDAAERLYRKGQLSDEDFTRYESVKAGRELSSERAMKHGLVEPDNKYTSKYQQKNSMSSYWAGKDKPDGYTDEQWSEITRDHEYYVPLADPDVRSYDKKYGTEDSDYAGIVNYVSRMLDYSERAYLYTARGKMGFAHMRGENQHFIQSVVWYKDNVVKGETTAAGKYSKAEAISIAASYMTDEEIDRFNTILGKYGAKEADDYFELLYETVLPARVNQAIDEDYDAMLRRETKYDENGKRIGSAQGKDTWALQITSTLLSTPLNIVEGIVNPWMTAKTDLQDPTAALLGAREGSSAQEIRNAVQENFGKWGRFWYGVGTSALDSMTVAAISGGLGEAFASMGVPAKLAGHAGSILGGSILGGSAFNSSYEEALQRGLSPDKARATAFGNGVNEMLFETLSLDMLVGHFRKGGILKVSKNGFVNWAVNTLVQGGVEGSEEVFTDMANNLWDKTVNGIYSEELTKLREYISQGMSYDEAKRKVNAEYAEQLGMSFLGGFASGGVMGGGASFMGMVQNRGNEKVGKGFRQNSRVMDELRNFDFKSEYAKETLQQKNLTNADIADLFNIMQQELLGRYKSDIQKAVADGKITQEQADLLNKYEQYGVQIVKDGKVVDNADGITVDQMPSVQDAITNLDNSAKIQFLDNEEMRSLVQAVGGETAAIIEQSETAERDAEKAYRQTVREINNDTTLSPELKQKRLEAAERTRQNARSEASKIADTALTNKKGIGAKLETDGNGTVKVGKGSGKVTYDFSTKDNPGHQTVDSMTATEQSALRIAKIVAASRPDVNVKVEAEFGVDENGIDHSKENGYYNPKTNTIHINMSGDNSVLWTLSHELTHHLANTDTEAYAALRTAIETALKDSSLTTTQLEERGFEYDLDRVDPYIAREGNLWDALVAFEREEHGYGKDAEEEVVARCCESFLGFNQFVKDFARKQYKSAKAINKFIAQMNIDMQRVSEEARQSAAQRNVWNDESPENQILRQLTEIDRIANLWRIAVNAEAKKRQAAREETRASTKDSVQMENRINKLREEIASIENDSERLFTNGREFDNARLKKLKNELNALIEQERKASVKTSLSDILANLDLYRRSDLISMAGQLTQAWDDVDEMTTQELRDGIREIIEEREYTPLELQAKSRGLWVRPATIASTKDSVKRFDAEYLDLARRYESGDKSVEADLRKQVDAAAERAMRDSKIRMPDGKLRRLYHGTYSDEFNVFDKSLIGTAREGDTGFFGKGFYFTFHKGEARMYGRRVIDAYVNITNPFNFETELNTMNGERAMSYNGGRAVFVTNFAEKFHELAKNQSVGTFTKDGKWKEISFAQFAKDFRTVYETVKFNVEEIDGAYGKEWLVTAGEHEESYTNENGETFKWKEYAYQRRYMDERSAHDQAENAYEYLSKTKYEAKLPASAAIIMDTAFSEELIKRNYDGVIQSEDGDEVVAFESSQIKKSDPVVYDDNGNIIPLSERFKTDRTGEDAWKNEDIRYSKADKVTLSSVDSPVVNRIADESFPIQPKTNRAEAKYEKTVAHDTKVRLADIQDSMFHPVMRSIKDAVPISERTLAKARSLKEIPYNISMYESTEKAIVELAKFIKENYSGKYDVQGNLLLPEETVQSNNIFSNASYLKDAEPTTECYRQTIYRAFLKVVTDQLGRPVTEREAIIVNQACIEIGLDAPCIYCYSLLDRKAKEGYKLQYLAERDAFLAKIDEEYHGDIEAFKRDRAKNFDRYNELYLSRVTDPAAYKDGVYDKSMARKGNAAKVDRVKLWLDVYESGYHDGTMITANDVRNIEAEEASLKEAKGNSLRTRELKDILYWSQSASQAKKIIPYSAYTNDGRRSILSWSQNTIDALNREYGLRWYSHADFHPAFIVDNMQQIMDASVKGLKGLMYVKPVEAAKIFAPTGMLINVSCFAQYKNGQYVADDRMGADWTEVQKLRKQYENVGAVMVVTTDDMWMWAMTQDWVDVIIPLHLVRSGSEFVDTFGLHNYSEEQADKLVGKAAKEKYEAFIADLAAQQEKTLSDKEVNALKKANKSIYPGEHENDYAKYMEACEKRGLTPRFDRMRQLIEEGGMSWGGKEITLQDYMKCVSETRMPYTKAQTLKPSFDFDAAKQTAATLPEKGFFNYFKQSSEWNGKTMTMQDWVDQAVADINAKKDPSKLGYGRDLAVDENGKYLEIGTRAEAKRRGVGGIHDTRSSKMDKVRLSTADGTRTYTLGDVTAKLYGNDVELDGGKVRQRVSMMEAIAEVNGTARVDAASEEEAEAFRRAGAEQVTEELEGHGAKYGTWEFKYEERKFTNDSRYDIKQKQKFAKNILKQVGKSNGFTQAQRVKYGAALGRLMDYLWEMQYGKMDGKVVFEFADRLFDSILNDYTAMSEADEEFRSELLANMTKTKNAKGSTVYVLEVNDKQMREIRYAYENAMAYASKLSKALGVRVTVKQTENAKTLEDIFTNSTDTRIKSDTNEGDMPGELLRQAQETESRKTNPYAAESEERQALKMGMFEAAMAAAGVEKSTAQQIREAVKETRKAERTKAKTEAKKAIDSARLAERMHEGALRAKDRRISENRERALKQHATEREAKLKQGFRETTQKANETRLKRDMRTIALKWNQRLVKLLANPTEASHVPVQLAREVAELTKTITEYIDNGTERGRINLEKVAKAYQQAFDDQATIRAAKEENIKYDPRGSVIDREMYDEQLVNMIDEMNEILADKSFKELSAREMMGLLNIIRGVAHTVYDANRMIGTTERKAIWQVGDQMVQELESAPKIKGGFARFFLEESLDLRRIAKVFSGSNENAEFVKLSDALNRGAIEKERVAQVLSGMFDPLTQQYGDEIRKWYGKNAEWIDTGITKNGRKVEITKGMRVSLAMHVLNTGNMRHIENGGVTIPNRELYAKGKLADAYANGTLVRLNADQINTIISQMTEAEKAYVVVAKEFFHQRTGYYVNKTSLQLLGYRKATVENYFPIHTDRNYTKTDFASVVRDGSIEGQGFLKERVMASNPVYLEDITSVVNRQIKGVSLYAGLAVPMRNFNAVMNASVYEDENGNWVPRTTVRKAMTQSMGEYGAKVVQGFLQDVSGMSAVDVTPGEQLVAKLQTRYVKAVLLANLKVTLKQAASYPTAAAVIPWKYLGKALLKGGRNHRLISRADVDLINQYTPLYKLRLDGMANEITSIMAERGLEQKMPWLLGWITKMDVATVGRLWSAAEYMVADQQNLPVGSDEYYKAVAEIFNQTIQQTQPNFTPLQRNAALRSMNPVVRTLTLFGTQRMQNGGILIESAMELAHSKNKSKEAQAAAKAKFGRAVVSQLVQNVMLVAIGFVVDALRGRMKEWQDDDKDVTLESVAKVMGDQFLGNIFGSFLGGSELWDIISTAFKRATNANAYDTEFTVPSLDAIETIIGFFNKDSVSFVQYMSGDHTADEKITRLKNFSFKLAKAAGYLTGFPFENIAKTIVKGWIPALQDIYDATQTGELIPWLHQSGKLDKKTTNANYKEWTNNGFKGSEYFYWENVLSQYGKREEKIPILLEADLPNEKKAMLLRMMDKSGATSEGTVVYKSNGDVLIDFANPTEKQQALPMPTAEPEETATPTTTPTATPKPTENPLTDARQEGVKEAVAKGVPEQTAFDAFLAYQNMGKNKSDDYSRNDDFRAWLFANVDSPEQRAVLEYQVIGTAKKVEGSVTYRESGVVFRDYTNESWFKLSEHNLSKDGTNKRYEAGKRLEKTGLSVDKTVAIYDALADYTKKAEWTEYLKKQGLTDEQVNIFLWSRGWAKLK